MTGEEIEKVMTKLREKYRDGTKKFGGRWFDLEQLDQRYRHAMENRMNMEGFVLAEISNYDKILDRCGKGRDRKSVSEKIDRILEEHAARIAHYPEIVFHPSAGFEIARFYGALSELARHYMAIFWHITARQDIRKPLAELEERLDFLAMPRGTNPSKRIQDHRALLSRKGVTELEIERDKNEYLKESAFLLHDIVDFCEFAIQKKDPAWETPLRMDKLYLEEKRKKAVIKVFTGMTGYGAILLVRDYAAGIIEDFRLGAFRRQAAD